MKALHIFLLVVIILGAGLLITQKVWIPPLVAWILEQEERPAIVEPSAATSSTMEVTARTETTIPKPAPSPKGFVKGRVLLSPTCPVERIPPDPACAPKGYQTTIRVQPIHPSAPAMTIRSDASGAFNVSLNVGTYIFKPQGGASMLPSCSETEISVSAGETKDVNLDCDTGIR